MEDSQPGGGSGPGEVDQHRPGVRSGWGNLPPKQREEAMQQISKGLPSHYREVIEEYFRKMAREGGELTEGLRRTDIQFSPDSNLLRLASNRVARKIEFCTSEPELPGKTRMHILSLISLIALSAVPVEVHPLAGPSLRGELNELSARGHRPPDRRRAAAIGRRPAAGNLGRAPPPSRPIVR